MITDTIYKHLSMVHGQINPSPAEHDKPTFANSVDPDEETIWSGSTLYVMQFVNWMNTLYQVIWLVDSQKWVKNLHVVPIIEQKLLSQNIESTPVISTLLISKWKSGPCFNMEIKQLVKVFKLYVCNGWKKWNNIFPRPGIEPGPLDSKSYIYHVAIKAGFYRKAVQVCYIPIPLQTEIRPWISSSPRITWISFMHTCGFFTAGAKCNSWKLLLTNAAAGDRTRAVCVTGEDSTASV